MSEAYSFEVKVLKVSHVSIMACQYTKLYLHVLLNSKKLEVELEDT